MLPTPSDDIWQRASRRWAEIQAISLDLAPAVALQKRLLRLILDASQLLTDPPPANLTHELIAGKWQRGVPALRNEQVSIPDSLKQLLPALSDVLAAGGAGDAALHIWEALVRGDIDAGSLLSVSLARNQTAIRTSALHMGLSPDLVWLVGELGSSPLAHHLQQQIMGSDRCTSTGVRLQDWDRGYCPFCGSWPAFIESCRGVQMLRCSFCALAWTLASHRCMYCGNAGNDFVAAAPDIARGDRRIQLCAKCANYTKVVEVAEPTPFPLLAIEDLASMDLDEAAMSRDYRRPELYDLDSLEPPRSTC